MYERAQPHACDALRTLTTSKTVENTYSTNRAIVESDAVGSLRPNLQPRRNNDGTPPTKKGIDKYFNATFAPKRRHFEVHVELRSSETARELIVVSCTAFISVGLVLSAHELSPGSSTGSAAGVAAATAATATGRSSESGAGVTAPSSSSPEDPTKYAAAAAPARGPAVGGAGMVVSPPRGASGGRAVVTAFAAPPAGRSRSLVRGAASRQPSTGGAPPVPPASSGGVAARKEGARLGRLVIHGGPGPDGGADRVSGGGPSGL